MLKNKNGNFNSNTPKYKRTHPKTHEIKKNTKYHIIMYN